ncbi:UNVERIFIED_CONTAM: hypothetical protein Scaly_0093000 [Sesamum calycinum]|uniref:Reverse transcriptase Ty1/copia-type domain-containing protein n=1 Tax=Sesamum calycinum TaxID=2727403 RepID=A0AAW2SY33_9LAMI
MARSSAEVPRAITTVTGSGSDNTAVWIQTVEDLNEHRKQNINGRVYNVTHAEHKYVDKVDIIGNNLVSELLEALRIDQTKLPHDALNVNFAHVNEIAVQKPICYSQAKGCAEWEQAMQPDWFRRVTNQIKGIDYFDRFSPVAKSVTMRTLLAASTSDWVIHQVDVNNAFLHGFLDEDIYILVSDGYSVPIRKDIGISNSKPTATPLYLGLKPTAHGLPPLADPEPYRRLTQLAIWTEGDHFCMFLGNALISWKMKKQSTISRSTAEAEYRNVGALVCEVWWISFLLQDLHILVADLFTKILPGSLFSLFMSKLGLVSVPQIQLEGGLKDSSLDFVPISVTLSVPIGNEDEA